jgi:hypothetical protein
MASSRNTDNLHTKVNSLMAADMFVIFFACSGRF